MLPTVGAVKPWTDIAQVAWNRLPIGALPPDDAWTLSLDGTWRFARWDGPELVDAAAVGLNEPQGPQWGTVPVPGTWLLHTQGMEHPDRPHYTNIQMPFPGPPFQLPEVNATAVHRTRFTVPTNWGDRQVILEIGGAESWHAVYLNGAFVGCGTDTHLPSHYDLTPFLRPEGDQVLAVVVVRYSAHSYLEDQDHWWMAGLIRSVGLQARPRLRIDDVAVVADWDHLTSTAHCQVDVTVAGLAALDPQTRGDHTVRVWVEHLVTGRRHGDVISDRVPHRFDQAYLFEGHRVRATWQVPRVTPWTAETPARWRLVVELCNPTGDVLDRSEILIGFRRVEVRDRALLVNGRRIMVRGVNRHDHHPDRGPAVTGDDMRDDLVAMKRLNLNAVRTAHYPPDRRFLDLCDELGMYVIDEANVETHAYNTSLCHDHRAGAAWSARTQRMVLRDRNHPCVIMWSLGNESGLGAHHHSAAAWIRAVDPTRPLHYEGATFHTPWGDGARDVTDVVCPMYASVDDIVAYGRSGLGDRPLVLCEYSHAMGNSNGGLARYAEAFDTVPGLQGGFVWEWKDHGLRHRVQPPGRGGEERFAYGGQFGDTPHDGSFVADGIMAPDLVAHPAAAELAWVHRPAAVTLARRWHVGQPVVMEIANRRQFTDLSDLHAELVFMADGVVVGRDRFRVHIGPGERCRIECGVPPVPDGTELLATIIWRTRRATPWAAADWEVGRDQLVLRRARRAVSAPRPRTARPVPVDELWGDIPDAAPRLWLWRAPTENDRFLTLSDARQTAVEHRCRVRVGENASVEYDHRVTIPDTLGDLPRVGVRFMVPTGFTTRRWYGRGPHENLPDRNASAHLGCWHDEPDDLPYVVPQSYGLRTDCSWMVLSDQAQGLHVAVEAVRPIRLHMAATLHTDEALDAACDVTALERAPGVVVHVDVAHRGVGTASCGPDTEPWHRISPGVYRFRYRVSAWRTRR
jgi:beta-galactosidase